MQSLAHVPFLAHLGCEVSRFHGGESELSLNVHEELTNNWGTAHGGVTMTLLDAAMGHAARSPDEPGGTPRTGVVTIEMKTSFMRPGVGRLTVRGRVMDRTLTLSFCEASAFDEQGALVAHATGTFKHLKALTVGGRKVQRDGASD
ncbi:PaaI family thioesterase [Aquincola sp. MAHUQ-54]|uniref:PaaI family thioesterase n=1 Tax=Aquincola agrisoli TaxID=3119538 RepID=A0AAW9QBM9_9BURK